jgi:hypothetical protein
MGDIPDGMYPRIGPAGSRDRDLFLQEDAQHPLETFLDGGGVRLDLPAAERSPVVGESDLVPHNECKCKK